MPFPFTFNLWPGLAIYSVAFYSEWSISVCWLSWGWRFTNSIAKEIIIVHPRKLTLAANLLDIGTILEELSNHRIAAVLIAILNHQCESGMSFIPLHKTCIWRAWKCPHCATRWCSTMCIVRKKIIQGGYQHYCSNEFFHQNVAGGKSTMSVCLGYLAWIAQHVGRS